MGGNTVVETGEGGKRRNSTGGGNNGKNSAFQFSWSQQGSRVLEQLRALFDNQGEAGESLGIQPDVVLFSSDGDFVEAHKMVLCLCSPYFQDLFKKISHAKCSSIRNSPTVVVLENVSFPQLRHLIQFIYTGKATIPPDQLEDFLETGKRFKLEGVTGRDTQPSISKASSEAHKTLNVPVSMSSMPPPPPSSEEVDISYESYPVKMETESILPDLDPLACEGDAITNFNPNPDNSLLLQLPTSSGGNSSSHKLPSATASIPGCSTFLNKSFRSLKANGTWAELEPVSEEALNASWRVLSRNKRGGSATNNYFCILGGGNKRNPKCPARIKRQIMDDGTILWFKKKVPHCNHLSKMKRPLRLSSQQKQFILECAQQGLTREKDIMSRFMAQGMTPPRLKQIYRFLSYRGTC